MYVAGYCVLLPQGDTVVSFSPAGEMPRTNPCPGPWLLIASRSSCGAICRTERAPAKRPAVVRVCSNPASSRVHEKLAWGLALVLHVII